MMSKPVMLTATLLSIAPHGYIFVRSPRREVKKKNGWSSVDGAMFSGKESKNAASALSDSNVEVIASKATSGPRSILNPCAWSLPRASCHSASVNASGRVLTVPMLPTFSATT